MSGRSEHAKAVESEIRKKISSNNGDEAIWGFVEGYAAYVDGVLGIAEVASAPFAGIANTVVKALKTARDGHTLIANPYFIGNGQGDDDPSLKTARYLKGRKYKDLGASGASVAGAVASVWTAVDVAGIATHGNACGSTAMHIKKLADMARGSRKTGTVAEWLNLVTKLKVIKLTSRTSSLIGASVPIPAVGMTTGILSAAISAGAKMTLSKACTAAALELHWRAKQEQFISGSVLGKGTGGGVGPASKILWELFTKRGITRILGKHDIASIVNEPAGWMAINDKLMLI